MKKHKILIIGTQSDQTTIAYNFLTEFTFVEKVIVENKYSSYKFLKNRVKKIGFIRVFDQILFLLFFKKLLSYQSKYRIEDIININCLSRSFIPSEKVLYVNNINDKYSVELINSFECDYIFVSGTRILSKNLISSVDCQLINLHAGITPDYRGVHGAYWALVNRKHNMAGVTLHKIDVGVDTGEVINQSLIDISKYDNIITYPFLQLVAGLNLLQSYLLDININTTNFSEGNSCQYYHPGFFQYLFYRITQKVK